MRMDCVNWKMPVLLAVEPSVIPADFSNDAFSASVCGGAARLGAPRGLPSLRLRGLTDRHFDQQRIRILPDHVFRYQKHAEQPHPHLAFITSNMLNLAYT